MQGYFIFIFIIAVFVLIGEITRKRAMDKLTIKRECDKYFLNPGETFRISMILENNKWLPVSFLYIEEQMPAEILKDTTENREIRGTYNFYVNSYSILWYERIRRTYNARINRRGVYAMRQLSISVGDIFGFSNESKELEDIQELVVYPVVRPLGSLLVQNNSIQGESIVKRWIYKDPLYIKGIREYNIEDRMKDIHWKSSLRMNKLMVKDYDYTSERELMIIVNNQAGNPYWSSIDAESTERSIEIAASLARQAIDEGVPTGMWTNAQVLNFKSDSKDSVVPSLKSFRAIMELCARADHTCRIELEKYLTGKSKEFNRNTIYVLITSFLDEESVGVILKLKRMGLIIKLIDTSLDGDLSGIDGVEKIKAAGGR